MFYLYSLKELQNCHDTDSNNQNHPTRKLVHILMEKNSPLSVVAQNWSLCYLPGQNAIEMQSLTGSSSVS